MTRQFYHDSARLIRQIGGCDDRDRGDVAPVHGEVRRARRDYGEVQAERGSAGRRAADTRLLVPGTPPAVLAVAPDDHAVILSTGALGAHAGAGGLRAARPVRPPVDHADPEHLSESHP
jgi:hypothetical protein